MPARAVELSTTYLKCNERLQAILFAPMAESYASSSAAKSKTTQKENSVARTNAYVPNEFIAHLDVTDNCAIFGTDDSHSHLVVFGR
jgi:hypothetical protein